MLTIALPKGRILAEALPVLEKAGLAPVAATRGEAARRIMVMSQDPGVRLIIVRAADVQTYVSYGTAQLGLVGRDLLLETPMEGVLHDIDMQVGKCRLAVAAPQGFDYKGVLEAGKHITVATKYPHLARQHFATTGIQAEIVQLHGSIELAPSVGLSDVIVDLVGTGETMRANNLVEVSEIMHISTNLVLNQPAAWRREAKLAELAKRLADAAKS